MILVTGGTGLLGSHLLYSLIKDGKKVRAIKRPQSDISEVMKVFSRHSDNYRELYEQIEWMDADILFPEEIDEAMLGISEVYHAAAWVSFDPRQREDLINTNTEGTANIVNACVEHQVRKLCHVSSTAALGNAPEGELVNEDMIWNPDKMNTGYSVSKFTSEMEVWRGIEEGLQAVIVNPGIIFGSGFWDRGSSSMFSNIYKGLKFYLRGVTAYVGVEDVVSCMRRLMESDISGQRFILASENLSYQEVFTMIAEKLQVKAPHIEPKPFLSSLAWRLDAFRSWFGIPRVITRETVMAGRHVSRFSNKKISEICNLEFEPLHSVIDRVGDVFLKEQGKQ